jgi:hypothetical protein
MAMDQLPIAVFQAKEARYPDGKMNHRVTSRKLGLSTLNFDDASEAVRYILRDEINARNPAFRILGCSDGQTLFNALSPSPVWAERVTQGHVISVTEKR